MKISTNKKNIITDKTYNNRQKYINYEIKRNNKK